MTAVVDSQQDCTTATVPSPPASSPGSLSSSTTNSANSQERVPPASPPPFCQVPPSSSTKPTLVSFQSSTNPQPFFPVATTPRASESPTSYQFPVVVPSPAATVIPASSIRTPSPPTVAQRQQQQQQQQAISGASRSTPRPARPRRHSTLDYTPTSAGRTAAMNGGNTPGAAAADGSNQLEAKVVILGSQGVGKTSIVHRFTSGHFSYSLSSTIGASFLTKKLIVEGCKVRLQIWDTAGQERFRSMAPLYYRGALAAILVYDITNEDSFNDIKIWLEELRRNMSPDLIIHVVGSKGDLAPAHRQVDLTEARRRIAVWVHEAREREASGDSSGIRSTRDVSPPSPTKSRLAATAASGVASRRGSLINSANASTTTVPTITTTTTSNMSPPATTETFGARVRKMSTKLGTLPVVQPISSAPVTPMMNGGGSNSAGSSMLDLGLLSGSTTTGTASGASTPGGSLALATHPPHEGLSRSHSSKLSLSLALSGSDSRSSTSSSSRAAARKAAAAAEEERRAAEEKEREEERMDQLVKECGIEVSEVSAKDDFGIEDLFLLITRRLVDRKAKIESDRVLRSRDSIMLRDSDDKTTPASGSWCC